MTARLRVTAWLVGARIGWGVCGAVDCGPSFTADDKTAADVGTREAADLLRDCATDDAGASCLPSLVRARARVIFCASNHAESVHGTPFDGGAACPK